MDENRRQKILDNIESLIDSTDFKKLCDKCYEYHLLSFTMIANLHRITPSKHDSKSFNDKYVIERERHKQLFIKITKRGPKAFEKLHQILKALNYMEALNILFDGNEVVSIKSSKKIGAPTNTNFEREQEYIDNDTDAEIKQEHSNNNITLHEYEDLIQPKKNILVQPANNTSIHPKLGSYHMESKDKRGILFLVRSDEHHELDDDDRLLMSLFQKLGFKVYAYSNITFNIFSKLLDELLCSEQIKDIECFVLVIRTRGQLFNGLQRMKFNDGSVVKIEEIHEYFYHRNCPELLGTPKIFIFPYKEIPRTQTDSQGGTDSQVKCSSHKPQLSDIINCYVTISGYMDHRDNKNFPRYIQNFVDVISEMAYNTHFDDMLKIIQDRVGDQSEIDGQRQYASYENISLNKTIFFNPGQSN